MKKVLLLFIALFMAVSATAQFTAIPDPTFELELINQGIDTDGVVNGQVATADISDELVLDVSGLNIFDLTGIEGFAALEFLNCSNNPNLGTLDLSQNAQLDILNCSNTGLNALDISNNLFLTQLYAGFNLFTSLNTANTAGLQTLDLNNGQVTALNVTTNNLLATLLVANNQLQGVLDLSQNANLTTLNTTGNPSLYCIQVADAAAATAGAGNYAGWSISAFTSYSEDCSTLLTYVPDDAFEQYLITDGYDDELDNYVFTANIETITSLDVASLGIADLTGIEDFTDLEDLVCSGNTLTTLDVSQNTNLLTLECNNNQLTSLTLNNALVSLICNNNQLTSLNVNQNASLNTLLCQNNQLDDDSILILSGMPLLVNFNSTNNPGLICIQVNNEVDATNGVGQYALWMKDNIAFYSVNCALSSEDFTLDDIALYPNPARSEVHLTLPVQLENAVIYNLQGQKVLESTSKDIDIRSLREGLYFITIHTSDNRKFTKKFLVSASQ